MKNKKNLVTTSNDALSKMLFHHFVENINLTDHNPENAIK